MVNFLNFGKTWFIILPFLFENCEVNSTKLYNYIPFFQYENLETIAFSNLVKYSFKILSFPNGLKSENLVSKPLGTLLPSTTATKLANNTVLFAVESKEDAFLKYQAPTSLTELTATTNFTKRELKLLYRSFKNVSTNLIKPRDQLYQIRSDQIGCNLFQAFPTGRMTIEYLSEALSVAFPDGGTTILKKLTSRISLFLTQIHPATPNYYSINWI